MVLLAFAHHASDVMQFGHSLLLPECARYRANVTTPVDRQVTSLHISMKAAVRPIANAPDVSVFDGIEVDIVHVTFEVDIVADYVFPKSTLPNSFLSFASLAC
jgi:hypothetical protein